MYSKKPFGWRRSAAIAIVVTGVVGAAMLFGGSRSSTRKDTKPATRTAASAPAASASTASAPKGSAPAGKSTAQTAVAKATPVTITGCLERDDQTFRLKDTEGADAPRSRNWKSGFLKKGSASIEVQDASNRLKLNDYVGQRVSLTGTLDERELDARSVRRVARTCEKQEKI